jgi:beta-glucosidase
VTFTLSTDQLAFWAKTGQWMVQPGTVEVMVGDSSQHLPLSGTFEIVDQPVDVNGDKVFFSDVRIE